MPSNVISKISPDGGRNEYPLKDPNAQPKTLSSPITIGGQSYTNVEATLGALAESAHGSDIYVDEHTLYVPSGASVSEGTLIFG